MYRAPGLVGVLGKVTGSAVAACPPGSPVRLTRSATVDPLVAIPSSSSCVTVVAGSQISSGRSRSSEPAGSVAAWRSASATLAVSSG
jgi:hypothetical protein